MSTSMMKYEWKITDVSQLSETNKIYSPALYLSPCYMINDRWCWKLSLEWAAKNPINYGVYLNLVSVSEGYLLHHSIPAKFSIKIAGSQNKILFQSNYNFKFEKLLGFGSPKAITIEDKESLKTITLELEIVFQDEYQTTFKPSSYAKIIKQNYLELYESEAFTDARINCGESEFKVHKAILAARSPVFNAMLNTEMKESKNNVIEINEVDPKAMKIFLKTVYTGVEETKPIPTEFISDVLDLAEKYDLKDLKEHCVSQIQNTVGVRTATTFMILADKYHLEDARKTVVMFMKKNLEEVRKSDEKAWNEFIVKQPHLIDDLFSAFLSH